MSRRDYSIPDCPKIGRYDGLGMAAVPLAIADKERELGINNKSNNSNDLFKEGYNLGYENGFECGKSYKESDNSCWDEAYKLGKEHGYDNGYRDGKEDGKLEIYKSIVEKKDTITLETILNDADIFITCYIPVNK